MSNRSPAGRYVHVFGSMLLASVCVASLTAGARAQDTAQQGAAQAADTGKPASDAAKPTNAKPTNAKKASADAKKTADSAKPDAKAQPDASAKSDASAKPDANAKPDATAAAAQSGEFVETPVGASATPAPAAGATPAAAPSGQTADAAPDAASASAGPFGFLNNLGHSATFFGDMWGLRTALAKYGMTLSVVENSEVLGNVTGGFQRGFVYEGLTTGTLQMDTQRAFGLAGGTFNVSALQIHGGNLSASNLGTLQTASGIESDRATRLWELWYQQKFGDAFDVKVGQQSIDQEFMVSQNSGYFINTMAGWPMLPSADMPGGGPAYPLSALGVRARAHINDNLTFLAGVYNGSPAPNNNGDPQKLDPYGTSFPLNGGVLAIAELQFVYPGPGTLVQAGESDPLARTYKIGMWYDSEDFADLRYNTAGQPLGNPANDQTPANHRGDYAFYAVADQMIWRSEDPDRNISFFARPMFTPLQDRNLVAFSVNAGLTMHEPFFGRDDDTAGIGVNFAQVSNSATGLDQDTAFYSPGVFSPVRRNETVIEATYQYEVAPWWQIQPDIQYVFNPGGGIVNTYNQTEKVKNETVLGVRTNITF